MSHDYKKDVCCRKPFFTSHILEFKIKPGTSLVVQWLRLGASNAGGMGSIPAWGTKIPHAMQCSQKNKQKKKTKLNLELKPTNFFCEKPESKYIQDLKPWFLLQLLSSTVPGKPENISK